MITDFYRRFEDRHRGSRELIKGRLRVYEPFIAQVTALYPDAAAVDIGCGRGEWLEILREHRLQAIGVDMDAGMLRACEEAGLSVVEGDGLAYLDGLAADSQVLVSAFHVAEHISFDQLCDFVANALRVLKPGGLLVIETPNPENIVVGTRNFYMDPTHQRPIPPLLLSSVVEFSGFDRVKTLRLQESRELAESQHAGILDVLEGVSPDYAIVAQKGADAETLARFDEVFARAYGLTLEELAHRYDRTQEGSILSFQQQAIQAESRAQQSEVRAQQAESRAQQAEFRAHQAEARTHRTEVRLDAAESREQAVTAKLEGLVAERNAEIEQLKAALSATRDQADHFHATVKCLHASTSWRITRPLRGIKKLVTGELRVLGPKNGGAVSWRAAALERARGVLAHGIRFVFLRPSLRRALSWRLKRFPWLHQRLLRAGVNSGAIHPDGSVPEGPLKSAQKEFASTLDDGRELTPRGQDVYRHLSKAIEQRKARS